jgi:hypothetical protein
MPCSCTGTICGRLVGGQVIGPGVPGAGLRGDARAPAGTVDARTPLSRRVFEHIVRFLYVQKKVFIILGLELPAGRVWPAAAVTPAPGEAPEALFPPSAAGGRLASVVTTTRC